MKTEKIIVSFVIVVVCFGSFYTPVHADTWLKGQSAQTKSDILVWKSSHLEDVVAWTNLEKQLGLGQDAEEITLSKALTTVQKYLIRLVWLAAVAMFIYAGFNLFMAKGDDKEYGKAWKALTYAAVGLAIIPLSYVVVKIVLGFNI